MRERVVAVLEELRPFIRADGGDVELVEVDEETGIVKLHMVGACSGCPSIDNTVQNGIKIRLQDAVPEVTEVRTV